MRDIAITLLVFGSIPFIFQRPWIGVIVWSWLGYMNPHRQAWGFAYDMPFAQIIALVLILAVLFKKDKRGIPINLTTSVWIFFLIWMAITTFAAIYFDRAWEYYMRILKIQLVTFFTLMLITEKYRLNALVAIIAFSIGFFSFKGGIFTLATGGGYRVYGPGGMMAENNAFALATLMVAPLFIYLRYISKNKWLRLFLLVAALLSVISALGSQSRGALVTLAAVSLYFWWQTKSKIISGIVMAVFLSLGWMFMPQSWHERMNTIETYDEDSSAMSRIEAWEYSINIANDRITGGGLESWSSATYAIYRPGSIGLFVAHSIYFNVLADHGWLGLALFLFILFLTWRNLSFVIRQGKKDEQHHDIAMLAKMLKVGMVAYMSGGAFLSLSYFDLPWHYIAMAVIMRCMIEDTEKETRQAETPVVLRRGFQ